MAHYQTMLEEYIDNMGVRRDIRIDSIGKTKSNDVSFQSDVMSSLINELYSLIGLDNIKKDVTSIINLIRIRKARMNKGIKQPTMSFHLVFIGNPGTGKTTVARLLAKIYYQIGILSKGHLVEVDRSGLVGGYIGQTSLKVKEVIDKAKGGILFIDEAYSLTSSRYEYDYGKEAIETLLKYMEDYRDDLIVIVAGYPELMDEFVNSNPGLKSRFNKYLTFSDYTPEELLLIFKKMASEAEFFITKAAEEFAFSYFRKKYSLQEKNFANARDVRNFFEKAMINQANRLSNCGSYSDQELMTIDICDLYCID